MTKQTSLRVLSLIVVIGCLLWIVNISYKRSPVVSNDVAAMSVILENGEERPIADPNFLIAFAELNEFTLQSKNKMPRFDRFFSITPSDIADFKELTKDKPSPPEAAPKERWYTASEGLKDIRNLQQSLAANANLVPHSASAKAGLASLETILVEAEAKGQRWHLR